VVADGLALIVPDRQRSVMLDAQRLVVPDGLVLVVLDRDRPVLLGVEVHLLAALLVLEPELVRASAARGGVALDRALGLLRGARVRGQVGAVLDAADDDGGVGIAGEEAAEPLRPAARVVRGPPRLAGPDLAHAHPA